MSVRTALRLELAHQPGELAKALRPLARASVNLHAVAGMAMGESSVVELLPNDLGAAAAALQQAGISAQELPVVITWLPNRPGALLKACEALAAAGINVNSVYVVSTDPDRGVQVTFECHDAERADQVLGQALS